MATNKALTTLKNVPHAVLIPPDADKDQESRLRRFCAWLAETGRSWHEDPDLAQYRDSLLGAGRVRGDGGGLAAITEQRTCAWSATC